MLSKITIAGQSIRTTVWYDATYLEESTWYDERAATWYRLIRMSSVYERASHQKPLPLCVRCPFDSDKHNVLLFMMSQIQSIILRIRIRCSPCFILCGRCLCSRRVRLEGWWMNERKKRNFKNDVLLLLRVAARFVAMTMHWSTGDTIFFVSLFAFGLKRFSNKHHHDGRIWNSISQWRSHWIEIHSTHRFIHGLLETIRTIRSLCAQHRRTHNTYFRSVEFVHRVEI